MSALVRMLARKGKTLEDLGKRENRNTKLGRIFRRKGVPKTKELERIKWLPRVRWQDDEEALVELCAELTDWLRTDGGLMALRLVQGAALQDLHDFGGLFAPVRVGAGKTLISYVAATVVGSMRPLLLVPAKLRRKTLREFAELRKHWLGHPNLAIMSYELLSRDRGTAELAKVAPDLIISDECFPGDTQVMCPEGARRIDSLREGDPILAVGPEGVSVEHVEDTMVRQTDHILEIVLDSVPHRIKTTPNHPFLTETGWVPAGELDVGTAVVCLVSQGTGQIEEVPILLDELFGQVADDSAGDQGESLQRGGVEKGISHAQEAAQTERSKIRADGCRDLETNAREEPNATAGDSSKAIQYASTDRAPSQSAGGQRETPAGTASEVSKCIGLANGVSGENRNPADVLQDRHREPPHHGGGGSRRLLSRASLSSRAGPEEGESFGVFRLARVASVESRRIERHGEGCSVHNVQVSRAGTYVLADTGAVVHNCHRLKNPKAGCTRKVRRWMREHPETRFAAMSGTITTRSLKEYAHIIQWCLGDNMPLPRAWGELQDWADALDEKVQEQHRMAPGALLELCGDDEIMEASFGGESATSAARKAYRRRLTDTPGVVATEEGHLGASLRISQLPVKLGAEAAQAFHTLRADWETPDGQPIMEAMVLWACARQLACGFFYKWDPPAPKEWMAARKEWAAFVRERLKGNARGVDTEFQVAKACKDGRYDRDTYDAWAAIRGTFKPNSVPVWIDDGMVLVAAMWLQENDGLCWTEHKAFALRLEEVSGVPYYGAQGLTSRGAFLEDQPGGPAIVSIAANSEGRNLQHGWSKNLIVSCPPNGRIWEQLMGRTHREGQKADEVPFDVALAAREQWKAFIQAQADAKYIEHTTGQAQKLLYSDVDMPSPDEVAAWALSDPMWRE